MQFFVVLLKLLAENLDISMNHEELLLITGDSCQFFFKYLYMFVLDIKIKIRLINLLVL